MRAPDVDVPSGLVVTELSSEPVRGAGVLPVGRVGATTGCAGKADGTAVCAGIDDCAKAGDAAKHAAAANPKNEARHLIGAGNARRTPALRPATGLSRAQAGSRGICSPHTGPG